MLFATNRTPRNTDELDVPSDIDFDIQNTSPSDNIFYCQRHAVNEYQQIGKIEFFKQLTDLLSDGHILFYLHGFNCTNEKEIFPDTMNMQTGFDEISSDLAVKIIPLIWPCDDDNLFELADDYFDDQRAADGSAIAFAQLIQDIVEWQNLQTQVGGTEKVHFLIHSMGTRVFHKSLSHYHQTHHLSLPRLANNIFLVAPDVIKTALEPAHEANKIIALADNIVIYYAIDDLAMSASELANLTQGITIGRLGKNGAADLAKLPDKVYQVNCQDFNNRFEFIIGHRYFIRDMFNNISPVLYHIKDAIEQAQITPNVREHHLYR